MSVCKGMCVCAGFSHILKSMRLIANRGHKTAKQLLAKTKTYLQSQKTLLESATHGALSRLEDIDGVYVRQNVLKCELQVWSDRLHHLYQRAVLLGHSELTTRRRSK